MAGPVQDFTLIPPETTENPHYRAWKDIVSVFQLSNLLLFNVIFPLTPLRSGDLCELYPSWANLRDVVLQTLLIIIQLILLVTLPLMVVACWMLPGVVNVAYFVIFLVVTLLVMRILNGPSLRNCLLGEPKTRKAVNKEGELWFYINGIATGYVDAALRYRAFPLTSDRKHWHQSNLDLLAETFQRRIIGIHNTTQVAPPH